MKKAIILLVLAVLVIAGAALLIAGWQLGLLDQPQAAVAPGAAMPDFSLPDFTGETHTLSQYRGRLVVLIFASHKCPFSAGADAQIAALAEQYREQEVTFLAIDSHYDTAPEELAAYAASRHLPYPILKDTGNQYADKVGAKRTPEIFIVDREGRLAYHGAFDSRRFPDAPGGQTYTADALRALLEGNSVPVQETRAWGCTIKRAG